MAFNYPQTDNSTSITIPPNVQYAIGVDGINTKVLPAGSTPTVVYRIGDGTVHPEGWENIDGNKYLDFYISAGATGAEGDQGEQGQRGLDGVSILSGTDVPTNDVGNNDDLFFVQDVGLIYKKINGYWELYFDVTMPDNPNFDDITADSLQLNGGTGDEGTMTWNDEENTVDLVQNGTTLQVGQELHINVKNKTGSTIPNGAVVMASGTEGASGSILISPYDGVTDLKYVIGLTTEEIANDTIGKVTTFGKIRDIDTSGWNEGDVLYPTSSGGLTNITPETGVINAIAFAINSKNNGTIMVRFTPSSEDTGGQYYGTARVKGIEYFAQSSVASDDITIESTNNALSVESFTIENGASVTVESGATWKVV